jgi:tetratricopeptide (TPR) repeat protein
MNRPGSVRYLLSAACYQVFAAGCLLWAQPAPVSDLGLGMALESSGQLDAARNIYMSALRYGTLSSEAYQHYEALEVRTGNFDHLVQFTDSLLGRNPGNAVLLMGKAEGLVRLAKKSQGAEILNGLTRTEPEYARQVGAVFEAAGMNQEAIQTYLDYRRRKNTPGIFAPNLVGLYEKTGDFAGATREAVTMLNVNPRLAEGYSDKFQFYARKSSAGQVLAELAQLKDQYVRADFRAKVLLAFGQPGAALDEITAMNSLSRSLQFAQFCEQSNYLDAAAELYGRLGRQYDQARILRKQGKVSEAATILEASSDPNAVFELAELQRIELHDYAAAAASYGRVIQAMPGREEAYPARAECLLRLGRLDDARRTLLSAPQRTDGALFGLAQIAFFQDSLDSAQADVKELMRTNPESPLVNDALELALLVARGGDGLKSFARARFDFLQGNLDQAVEEGKALVRSDTSWADQAYLLLADCYRQEKEPNQALGALEELEQNRPQSPFRAKARYQAALTYLEDLKDQDRYEKTMASVYVDFPESPYSALARNRLVPSSKPHD